MLLNAFNGYHTCVFAYGQTGSGKSYSIVGYGKNIGIVPMICMELFKRIDAKKAQSKDDVRYELCVSMLEIYNECI